MKLTAWEHRPLGSLVTTEAYMCVIPGQPIALWVQCNDAGGWSWQVMNVKRNKTLAKSEATQTTRRAAQAAAERAAERVAVKLGIA